MGKVQEGKGKRDENAMVHVMGRVTWWQLQKRDSK